jgi:hypothetical protein
MAIVGDMRQDEISPPGLLAAIRGQRFDWRADARALHGARDQLKQPHG